MTAFSIAALAATAAWIPLATSADAATTVYVAPSGSGTSCTQSSPCSIDQAQSAVRSLTSSGQSVTVELADGTYRISSPLQFRAEDGGRNGGTVLWTAASGANPVITGAQRVSGWSVYDSSANIYVANTPSGLDTRQLYVNGVIAPRAAIRLNLSDVTLSASGIRINNGALSYLNTLPQQNRIEFETLGDFTNRYTPVSSISNNVMTMAQPAWNNNTWGYDTVQNSFLAAPTYYLDNSLRFLTSVGQWFIDPSAGRLYFKPAPGVDPNGLDIELPRLQSLLSIGGSSYSAPVSNLEFRGLQFSGTSWLGPSSSDGYADQQNGSHIRGAFSYRPSDAFDSCKRGCTAFERARNVWYQIPAAVQVSAASSITFTNNTFTALGQTALGIGEDADATLTGVGLGASGIDVLGNRFSELAGQGIVVGGVRPDAHHPSDSRMTNKNILIQDNTINRVAVDYKDGSGILSTYVTGARIIRNEVTNVSYDGIDTGYGWGMNDAGGSNEYTNRGYYNYSPRYSTATTLRDNYVANNLVHNTKARFSDGGSMYNLSASPASVFEKNYLYNISGVGLYLDEGTRYTTWRNNVLQGASPWVFTNSYGTAHNTSDNVISGNWYNSGGASTPDASLHNNQISGNVQASGTAWPSGAADVICAAGVASAQRTNLNGNLFAQNANCGQTGSSVAAPLRATAPNTAGSFLTQSGSRFGLSAAGTDVWGGGGQRDDQYGAIYQSGAVTSGTSVTARVDSVNDANAWAKTGVMIRNDMTQAGSSGGYALVAVTPRNGVAFHWDSNGDGYVDSNAGASVDTFRAVWVKLTRNGNQATGYYSYDGANWVQIGSTVTLTSAASTQDGGIFTTSHDRSQRAVNVVSDLRIVGPGSATTTTTTTLPTTTTTSSPKTTTTTSTTTTGGGSGNGALVTPGGMCLGVSGSANGASAQIQTCNGGSGQSWSFDSDGSLRTLGGSMCLDANGRGTANGTALIIYSCNGQANQQFAPGANSSIVNSGSGRCVDVPNGSTTDGTQVQLYDCWGGDPQKWTLQGGGTPPTTTTTTTTPTTPPTTTTTTRQPTTTTTTTTQPPTTTTTTSSSGGGPSCLATYTLVGSWGGGFQGDVKVTNTGGNVTSWNVTMNLPSGVSITSLWSGVASGSTGTVRVSNAPYNGALGSGASTAFGFTANGNATPVPSVTCSAS